ncbi:15026_t:CDS:2, partial [Funneliformis geosporum]
MLLSFLIERKVKVNQLSTKRGGSSNTKVKLWQDASAIFLNNNYQYSAEQCSDDMDHNKQSGNNPIEVQYKEEVENILDGNHPSLTPKSLN